MTVEADMTVSAALSVAMDVGLSRLPVSSTNVDDMIGIAYAKDLMRAERAGGGDRSSSDHVRDAHGSSPRPSGSRA